MRILFSGNPAFGHLYPMLPLAAAARRRGHGAAFLTSRSMTDALAPFRILSAGPSIAELSAEYDRRHPPARRGDSTVRPEDADGSLGGWVEFFAGLRVESALPEALDRVDRMSNPPDLIIAETADWVGPLVASRYGIPWARHAFGRVLPDDLVDAMRREALGHCPELEAVAPRIALLDPWPDRFHQPGAVYPADRIVIRPDAPRGGLLGSPPDFGDRSGKPVLLITFGTVAYAPTALRRVLASVADLDLNVVVTWPPFELTAPDHDPARVKEVGDVTLADLVGQASVVLSAGGPGTILESLAQSRPLVLLPLVMDQQQHAEATLSTGASLMLDDPDDAGAAVRKVLGDDSFRQSAAAMSRVIAGMPSPDEALDRLLAALP